MRLVTFNHAEHAVKDDRVGVIHDGRVIDLFATAYSSARSRGLSDAAAIRAARDMSPDNMIEFFTSGAQGRRMAEDIVVLAARALAAGKSLSGPRGEPACLAEADTILRAPVPRPRRIRDYLTYSVHATGSGLGAPDVLTRMPICYKCNVESIIGPKEKLLWPAYTNQLDFEFEIGFFTGAGGRNLSVREAESRIAGITIFNDVSARDIQFDEMAASLGPTKGKDFCTAMGPCVLTIDEVADEFAIECVVRVNGEEWVRGSTGNRSFSFAEILAWASYCEDVYAGEFFAVGTMGGGCGLELGRWIRPGDVVDLEAAGVGVLSNPVGEKEIVPAGSGLQSYNGSPRVGGGH